MDASATRVLVVDDSKTTRLMIRRGLIAAGVDGDNVAFAEDGAEALSLMAAGDFTPDLVLSDINMPVMDGVEFLEELSRQGVVNEIPVVMITSVNAKQRLLPLIRLGARAIIKKPFNPMDLQDKLAPFLVTQPTPEVPEEYVPEVDVGPDTQAVWDALDQAVSGVLGTMGLVAATPVDEVLPLNRVLFCAEVAFSGHVGGHIALSAPSDVAGLLSEAFTGEDPGTDDLARVDAMAEIANVLIGEFLSVLADMADIPTDEVLFGRPVRGVRGPGVGVGGRVGAYALGEGPGRLYLHLLIEAGDAESAVDPMHVVEEAPEYDDDPFGGPDLADAESNPGLFN